MAACPFSGQDCLEAGCKAWLALPGEDEKQCIIIAGHVASLVLAERKLQQPMIFSDEEP